MDDRIFTLDDTNRILPLVRVITRDAVRRYREVKLAIRELEKLKNQRRAGMAVAPADLARRDAQIEALLVDLRRLIDELEALGCRLRDYEKGVIDFPAAAMDGEHFLFYCWELGEGAVSHWHSEEEGHTQRRLVEAPASA